VHFQPYGSRCRLWVPPEDKDPILLHHPTRKSVAYFGAVRLRDGRFIYRRETERFNGQSFWDFLKLLRQRSRRRGQRVVVITDHARYHHAKMHQAWRDAQAPGFRLDYIFVQRRWYRGRFSTPKGKKARRFDMSRELRRVLTEFYDQCLLNAHKKGLSSIADDLVFPGKDGMPLRSRRLLDTYFAPVLERAKLRRFRFHDLRHTFGSLLIEEGAPLPYVRDQLGHSSIQITADKYVHLVSRRNVHFIDRLDEETTPQESASQAQVTGKPERHCSPKKRSQVIERKALWMFRVLVATCAGFLSLKILVQGYCRRVRVKTQKRQPQTDGATFIPETNSATARVPTRCRDPS